MGSANSAAFLQGTDDLSSAAQMCPLSEKTVALYPVRWAISQEEAALPTCFTPPDVALEKTHYCLRTLKAGWVYLYSELYGALLEYRVDEGGVIEEVIPGANSVLLPDTAAESALPCIHHPAEGTVFLKFVQHRWTSRLQNLVRVDAEVRNQYMQTFKLAGLIESGQAENVAETEQVGQFVEEFREQENDFQWSLTDFARSLSEPDLQGLCKKETEFSYCVALYDEIGITSELGQLHALYVNLITNYAEENVYPYTASQLVDALIEHEASKKSEKEEQEEVRNELKERVRVADKDAFMEQYQRQVEQYDRERSRIFEDWKSWIGSAQIAKKVEMHDIHSSEGFEAVEIELADILDGYVAAEKGKEDAIKWLEAEEGESDSIGSILKTVLFLVPAANIIVGKLEDLPKYDYGSQKIVDNIQDMPGLINATNATDSLLLEFAAPAAQMKAWAKNPAAKPQWDKWQDAVAKRYGIDVHRNGMTMDTAVELLRRTNSDALEAASGHMASEYALSPLAAAVMDNAIRSRLQARTIEVFHLTPDFRDNPFGWLNTRLDPVVERIKDSRGKFIGAVAFVQAFNLVSLYSGLRHTHQDMLLGDRSVFDRWLPFVDGLMSVAESVVSASALFASSEYGKALKGRASKAIGPRLSVLTGTMSIQILSGFSRFLAAASRKVIPIAGPILAIGLEVRTMVHALATGHRLSTVLAAGQIGLSVSLFAIPLLAFAGVLTGGVGIVIGVGLIAFSVALGAIQAYIARSRIEDFLSLSFWGNAPKLRYWEGQNRPSNLDLLERSKEIVLQQGGEGIRGYYEVELDAFFYMLFSPRISVSEHMSRNWAITRQGEHKILPEMTAFTIGFPGYEAGSCLIEIRVFGVNDRWLRSDEWEDITGFVNNTKKIINTSSGPMYKYVHYNHGDWEKLELLVSYEKNGRKITGEDGLRVILDGGSVKELGVDEKLTFEL